MRLSHTALHESAHCVISSALGNAPAGASIRPTSRYRGITFYEGSAPPARHVDAAEVIEAVRPARAEVGEERGSAVWLEGVRERALSDLAGPLAEFLYFGEFVSDPERRSSDWRSARACTEEWCITSAAAARRAALRYFEEETKALLRQHWALVIAVARALQERGALTGEEIAFIIRETVTEAARSRWGN